MTARMRTVSQRSFGGPEVLELVDADRPQPGLGETLVRVQAASVNPADWKIRSGLLPRFGPPPLTLGRPDRSRSDRQRSARPTLPRCRSRR